MFKITFEETLENKENEPRQVGLKTTKGISFFPLTKSMIDIFFSKHKSNSFSVSKPSVEKSKTEKTFLLYNFWINGIHSFSFNPPQKWSKTVILIKDVKGRLYFNANLVNEVVILTKDLFPIILNRNNALLSSKLLFKENASFVFENILLK